MGSGISHKLKLVEQSTSQFLIKMNKLVFAVEQLILNSTFIFITLSYLIPWWIPFHIYRWVVINIFARYYQSEDFGKALSPYDSIWADEDFTKYTPKNSLICTFTLEGDIKLEEFRSIFKKNVLEAELKSSASKVRYPELQQFQVNYMGHKFWKNDPNYKIQSHIFEVSHHPACQLRLASVHQDALNKLFTPKRSPWDVTLYRNYENDDGTDKTLVLARFHHSIADAKSIMKLFVECLGQQKLTTAQPQNVEEKGFINELFDFLNFPCQYVFQIVPFVIKSVASFHHPWCTTVFVSDSQSFSHVVGLTEPLSLEDMKSVAKKFGERVTSSSVMMAMITGAIGKMGKRLREEEVHCAYILPKPDHPPTLGTHACAGGVMLPTTEVSPEKRLFKCQKLFSEMKASGIERYSNFLVWQLGTLINVVRKLIARNICNPVGITNIAGEAKGFSVGKHECSEFIFSAGTLTGCAGVAFCTSSYKNKLRIAVMAKESILDKIGVKKLAAAIGEELEILKTL
ncbi:hypothetical protein Ocin01_09213 [Orchesella cincta]|uniref:O-acyltransferase WSD1 C-terminal domain-containing protein n=1 Tax=Orchesella cincta TaxID=48709 RepID=A0A1D2MWQ7_ORCCI|nr:hypothetical protein Ocin01_09213 [Orchesella cincta]